MRSAFSSFSVFFQAFSWIQTFQFHSRKSSMRRANTLHRISRPVMKTMFVTLFIVQLILYFGVLFFPSSCKFCERSGFSLSTAAATTRFNSLGQQANFKIKLKSLKHAAELSRQSYKYYVKQQKPQQS